MAWFHHQKFWRSAIINRVFLFVVALVFATSAHAVTISSVTPISGVDPIIGTGALTTDGLGGYEVSTFIPFTATQGAVSGFDFFFSDTTPSSADTGFVQLGGATGVTPFLSVTNPLEMTSAPDSKGDFVITAHYDATPFLQPVLDLILLEIDGLFNADPLVFSIQVGQPTLVTITPVAAIPLPAGVWLMLAGLGGFAVMRRSGKA